MSVYWRIDKPRGIVRQQYRLIAQQVQWKVMYTENEIKRIYWGCRRGMLELDLVMVPFFEQRFRQLADQDQQRFVRLLECEDTQLFQWFLGKGQPEDADLAAIVETINAFTKGAAS